MTNKHKVGDKFKVTLKVKRVVFERDGESFKIFTAMIKEQQNMQVKTKSGKYLKNEEMIKGNAIYLSKDDTFTADVTVQYDRKFGYSLELDGAMEMVMPESTSALVAFMQRKIKGCGKATAEKIVDAYGMDTFDVIVQSENALQAVGITDKKAGIIREAVMKLAGASDVVLFLTGLTSITVNQALLAFEHYKGMAVDKIKRAPYSLTDIDGIPFRIADEVAKGLNTPANTLERVTATLFEIIKHNAHSKGDMAVAEKELIDTVTTYLDKFGAYSKKENDAITEQLLTVALNKALASSYLKRERNKKGESFIYIPEMLAIENGIARRVMERLHADLVPLVSPFSLDAEIAKRVNASDEQKHAIKTALTSNFSILTGGPGSGKTYTVNTIVETLEAMNPTANIVMMAPTGKAAKRMEEATGKAASTIHRKLKINEFGDNGTMLEADFVIVDEASMIDARLFNQLLQFTQEDARILIVGDTDQLPSIGAGLVLRDLIASKVVPVSKLTKVFRQAESSDIIKNARKIAKGIKTTDGLIVKEQMSDMLMVRADSEDDMQVRILQDIANEIKAGTSMADLVVLSPMRKGTVGVYELNKKIQETVNPADKKKAEIKREKTTKSGQEVVEIIREGDRVMQLVNNVDKDTMNGEVGTVLRIYADNIKNENGTIEHTQIVEVDYGQNKIGQYIKSELNEIELAYAMTIHKSQGSEYKKVIMALHNNHDIMLQRNLVYTAITRAKEQMLIVGSVDALNTAIERNDNIKRVSLLKEKLQAESKKQLKVA